MAATPASVIGISRHTTAIASDGMERWFFFGVALFFFASVLLGFVPDSVEKVQAVAAGQRPPFPLALHAHAVVMGSWILLLLTQTFLVASGHTAIHRQLGLVSVVLIPVMVAVMFWITRTGWMSIATLPAGAMPPEALASTKAIVTNILIEQIKAIIFFPLFAIWGISVRRTDPQAHKRLLLMATLVPMMAAVDRLAQCWLPTTFPAGYDIEYVYFLLWLAPLIIYDLWRNGRVHRVLLIGIAFNIPFFVFNHFMWGTQRWADIAPKIMGLVGVPHW